MWVSMLQSGRTAPAIEADDFHVDVTFTAGIVDAEYVRWISALGTVGFSPEDVRSLNCQIALKHLKDAPTISQHMASQLMQTRPEEAAAQLAWLVSLGLLEEARSPREWQLSTRARSVLDAAGGSAPLAGPSRSGSSTLSARVGQSRTSRSCERRTRTRVMSPKRSATCPTPDASRRPPIPRNVGARCAGGGRADAQDSRLFLGNPRRELFVKLFGVVSVALAAFLQVRGSDCSFIGVARGQESWRVVSQFLGRRRATGLLPRGQLPLVPQITGVHTTVRPRCRCTAPRPGVPGTGR